MTFSNVFSHILSKGGIFKLINKRLLCCLLLLSTTVISAQTVVKNTESKNTAEQNPKQAAVTSQLEPPPQKPLTRMDAAWQLSAEQWELARSGATILSLPVLNSVVKSWLADRQKMIEIRYPGGEDGELWVQELANWLVSLGIPSKSLVINAGSGADDVIKFNIINKQ